MTATGRYGDPNCWCGPLPTVDGYVFGCPTHDAAPTGHSGSFVGWHIGRSFNNRHLEDGCPCAKAPCGLVVVGQTSPDCVEHPRSMVKTIRQSHPAGNCPAIGEETPDA